MIEFLFLGSFCFQVSFPLRQRLLSFVDWLPFVVPIARLFRVDDTCKERPSLQTWLTGEIVAKFLLPVSFHLPSMIHGHDERGRGVFDSRRGLRWSADEQ